MGDLRDQLKKAKILSDQRARQLAHEERVHRKEVGREGLAQEEAERRAELERLQAEERATQKAAQDALDEARREAEERAACAEILRRDAVQPRSGPMRWYFELEDGALPWFEVDEGTSFKLQSGVFWIVRTGPQGSHEYALLQADLGARVLAALPEAVVWVPGGLRR